MAKQKFYGRRSDPKAEARARRQLQEAAETKLQAGEIEGRDANAHENDSYVRALAYGGYSVDDVFNDMHSRKTGGGGGIVHPDIRRGTWFSRVREETGTAPPEGNDPGASQTLAEQLRQSEDDQVRAAVDPFVEGSKSIGEFQESEEAQQVEQDLLDFFGTTPEGQDEFESLFGFEMREVEERKELLKEDTDTALERILEDRGFFGDDVKTSRRRLDQDRARTLDALRLQEARGGEDFDTALRRLDIQERKETEGLGENLNQRNIFGEGVGDILRGRLAEEQGLRRGQQERGFARFGEDIGIARQGTEQQFGRQLEDLDRKIRDAELGFGRGKEDVRADNTRRTFELDKALERQRKGLERQRQEETEETIGRRFAQQALEAAGVAPQEVATV